MAKIVRVSSAVLEMIRDASKQATDQVRCCWCFTPKVNHRNKCEVCGHMGNTRMRQSDISRVYVEEF